MIYSWLIYLIVEYLMHFFWAVVYLGIFLFDVLPGDMPEK